MGTNNWGCDTGKVTTEYLEKEIGEVKENLKLLEGKVWKLVLGFDLIIIIMQAISLLTKH